MGDLNIVSLIFSIIGGLGLFIFGIKMMGDGLQKVAGQKMREILAHLTKNRFIGLGLGAFVTSIIQSSSATTVMVIGFVNVGLMNLVQSIPIILGADIGTTITAQLIAFKLTDYALPIVGIGASMYLFAKKRKTKQLGESILGFGILFLGLSIMSGGVKPLGSSPIVHNTFVRLSYNPFLGVLVGTIATGILQSSSVTTGIILSLASVGLLDLRGAIPLVLGANIGTCITAVLASIGANLSAKRAAFVHVVFKVIGTMIALLLFPIYILAVTHSSTDIMRQIANFHTIFNVVNGAIFIGFTPLFVKLMKKVVPGKEQVIERGPKYLDKNLLKTPTIAIEAAKKEILRTLKFTKEMLENAMNVFYENNKKKVQKVWMREDIVDELQESITNYVQKITEKELDEKESAMIPSLFHSINDIERIADHATNLTNIAERKIDEGIVLSKTAVEEIRRANLVIMEMMDDTIKAFPDLDKQLAKVILDKEERINRMVIEFRCNHVDRLGKGICKHLSGLIFVDILMNMEKVGDHLTNIAQAIQGRLQWNGAKNHN
ncbi:MAG: Na/Pi cotransporter family protein [Nanoarchaeota archaeon]|nr:Na/Pi cotransporter family protein [Nanoarchaeota archaeon]MBU1005219.1 Na/Pi cotransporter family protein [Nanoarchaeota archaeon]MBU1946890.1 Na/Pi cotransporter family protein [Nanoarchaeota archaeon]